MRHLASAACGVVLALLCFAPASAGSPLVGNWSSTMGPPQPLGVAHTSRIRSQNPNFFIGTTDDGTSAKWIRMPVR